MGLSNFQRYNKGDYPDAPEWFHKVMEGINLQMENVTTYLQGNGNSAELFNSEERELTVKSDTEQTITLQRLKGKPTKGWVVWSDQDYPTLSWSIVDQNRVSIKIKFGTATNGKVKLRFEA